ncbi:MAG: protein kinase [Chlamydiia bacterium]|nr:protein kinase [Chlamydiia bacterium]
MPLVGTYTKPLVIDDYHPDISGGDISVREAIKDTVKVDLDSHEGQRVFQELNRNLKQTFPGIAIEKELGKGSFSTAYHISYMENGERVSQVLKLTSLNDAKQNEESNKLAKGRVGGEWLAFLQFDEHVLKTTHAIAYDHVKKEVVILDAGQIQEMIKNPQELNLTLFGTVSEYLEGAEELSKRVEREGQLSSSAIQEIGDQILQGVASIHAQSEGESHLIHRDLKAENILITPDNKVKIFDFGAARFVNQKEGGNHHPAGTLHCLAPELLKKPGSPVLHTSKVDVYSVGSILSLLATGTIQGGRNDLWEASKNNSHLLQRHVSKKESGVSDPVLRDFIIWLGDPDPEVRPTPQEAQEHEFFFTTQPSL